MSKDIKISIETLRKTKGIGTKTLERILKQHREVQNEIQYFSEVQQQEAPKEWQISLNNIYQGEAVNFTRNNVPNNSVDLVVTSPPYDDLREYNGYSFNYKAMLEEIYRVLKDGGVCVWVVGDATVDGSETGTSFRHALYGKEIGFNLHDTMIWQKSNPFNFGSNNCYIQSFEYMFVFSKGKPNAINLICDRQVKSAGKSITCQRRKGDYMEYDKGNNSYITKELGKRHNVWEISASRGNGLHPAVFPEKLAKDHILSWSNVGDIVLDPMCGSGTVCKMAKLNDRNFIGIDISEEYVGISKQRVKEVLDE